MHYVFTEVYISPLYDFCCALAWITIVEQFNQCDCRWFCGCHLTMTPFVLLVRNVYMKFVLYGSSSRVDFILPFMLRSHELG